MAPSHKRAYRHADRPPQSTITSAVTREAPQPSTARNSFNLSETSPQTAQHSAEKHKLIVRFKAEPIASTSSLYSACTTTMADSPKKATSAAPPKVDEAPDVLTGIQEPKLPSRKDTSLKEFLGKMDDYVPIIPDGVTSYYMTRAGLPPVPTTDPRLARLLALATQKFIADIAADAYQYSRIRSSNSAGNNPMGNLAGASGIPGAGGPVAGEKEAGKRGGALGIQRPGYGGGGQGGGQGRTVLTMEDLGMAVGEYGVNVKRGEFYR